ncbi:MAG: UDP-N-acetylglucosamine--LPS N-acetylglucosamine transferase [Planctomycetota bacterium]
MANLRIVAICSGGGHWVQMQRLLPAFAEHSVTLIGVDPAYRTEAGGRPFHWVNDANRWNKFGLVLMALRLLWILIRLRPHIAISTGAAPGYVGLRIARWFGARTIWVDSIANVEQLSMSGRMIGPHADLWLTQWPDLARPGGPTYEGAVF